MTSHPSVAEISWFEIRSHIKDAVYPRSAKAAAILKTLLFSVPITYLCAGKWKLAPHLGVLLSTTLTLCSPCQFLRWRTPATSKKSLRTPKLFDVSLLHQTDSVSLLAMHSQVRTAYCAACALAQRLPRKSYRVCHEK